MSELIPPAPLVDSEVELRDFSFMPLEFNRLFKSETWTLGNDAEKLAALHLWCESWHEVPAASLPSDDRMLAKLSGAGARWKRVKAHALRGWVKCSDGRLYHPIVAEKAREAWDRKLAQRAQTYAARIASLRRSIERCADPVEKTRLEAQLQDLIQAGPPPVTASKGKGQGSKGTGIEVLSGPAGAERTRPAWQAFTEAYRIRYGIDPTRNAPENAAMARFCSLVPLEEAPAIAAFYVGHGKAWYVSHQHSVKYLAQDAAGLRTQWLAGRKTTETEARQGDKTAARGAAFGEMLAEARAREQQQ